ncbi:Inner membrane protein YiaV OS=Afipia felis OX=1035 GN=yiaV PE=3 SV=1 [Afipia felis]
MIIFFTCVYVALLFTAEKLKIIRFNLFWKISPLIVYLLLNIGLFIPMGWAAPAGNAILGRYSVQIAPNVAGEVIDIPVQANAPIKKGDILFRIDPTPYEAQVHALEAQLRFQELRLSQATQLQERGTGRAVDVDERRAEVDRLHAQLDSAKWNLDSTIVRAPADGIVTNLALRPGHRVAPTPSAPVMAFIDTSDTLAFVAIPQNNSRYIKSGQRVEFAFKALPGRIVSGHVEAVLPAIATGQSAPSGAAIISSAIESKPIAVRVTLDDKALASSLISGSTADAAIFTDRLRVTHIIRKIILRQLAILNYINLV